jgi:hypothetical protein
VYYFTQYDIDSDKIVTSKRMATLEAIKNFNFVPLMDTAQEVDGLELDEYGRYPKTASCAGKSGAVKGALKYGPTA